LALDPIPSAASSFALQVERFYAGLISTAEPEAGLGGKFLYAGPLDEEARAMVVAANIAGAATLTASSDVELGKQAIRDGVVDFLVTSLDEALRILKNEIRKREAVAVCVALAPEIVEQEMRERGVQPDLTRPVELALSQTLLTWRIASSPALWLPKLDAVALDCLDAESDAETASARRWLRLAPRYLGRMARNLRLLRCNNESAARFQKQIQELVEREEIGVAVELWICRSEQTESCYFTTHHDSIGRRS
jgi:urocanate hydratase